MNWLDAAKKLAASKMLVLEQTDAQTAEMRWNTCWYCEQMNHSNKTCRSCGCYIELKIWSKISRSVNRPMGELTHCPLGKWQDKEITNYYRTEDGKEALE